MPHATKVVAALGVTTIVKLTIIAKNISKKAADRKNIEAYNRLSKQHDLNNQSNQSNENFNANSPFEDYFFNCTKYFFYILCLVLVVSALLVFTLLCFWVVGTKYASFLSYLNKQNLLN